jgi:hypothetical protein
VQGAGCRVQGAGCRVQGAGVKSQGSGVRGQGLEFRGGSFGERRVQELEGDGRAYLSAREGIAHE